MPDKITAKERAAILAFRGPVQHCPDGEAMHARMPWFVAVTEDYLSAHGLSVVPEPLYHAPAPPNFKWKFRHAA